MAAIRAALAELNRYPDGGSFALRDKIAARHRVSPEQIFMGSGSCEIINLLAFLFLRPGLNCDFIRACLRDLSAGDGRDRRELQDRADARRIRLRPRRDRRRDRRRHAHRVSRQSEQSDRHDLSPRRMEAFSRSAFRSAS